MCNRQHKATSYLVINHSRQSYQPHCRVYRQAGFLSEDAPAEGILAKHVLTKAILGKCIVFSANH